MVSESPSVSKMHWTNAEQSRNDFFILFLNGHIHEPKLEVTAATPPLLTWSVDWWEVLKENSSTSMRAFNLHSSKKISRETYMTILWVQIHAFCGIWSTCGPFCDNIILQTHFFYDSFWHLIIIGSSLVYFAGSFYHQSLAADCFFPKRAVFIFISLAVAVVKFVTSPIKQMYSHTKLCSPGFRKSQRSPVVLQIVSFHLLCTSIHPSLLLLHSLFPPFMVKSSHTNEPFLTDISLQVWAVTMCCFFWVGGGWYPCVQSLSILEAVPAGAGGKSCLSEESIAAWDERPCSWFPSGFFFFYKVWLTTKRSCWSVFAPFAQNRLERFTSEWIASKGESKNLFPNCSVGQISLWSIFQLGMFYIKTMN